MVDEAAPTPEPEKLVGDTTKAVEFLKHWMPNHPVLTASHTSIKTGAKGLFETKSFPSPVDWDAVYKWIATRQGKANLYFSVNPVLHPVDKKAGREDIASLIALHVDCDIRPGEPQKDGIARIIKTFEAYKHPPSDIIASGGGAQAFWRLSAPVPIDGDATIYEDLKLYNIQVERDLSGDNCHNVDRIMRLPGTINIPNEVKIKKGRRPSVAEWYSTSTRSYALSTFTKAPVLEPPKVAGFDDTGSYERVRSDDPRLKELGANWVEVGVHGDLRGKYVGPDGKTDRSRMALAFVTACLRVKIPEQLVASILMDASWVIGECVRDKGGTVARHLKRLIERAAEFVEDDFSKPVVLNHDEWTPAGKKFHVRVRDHMLHSNGEFFCYGGGLYRAVEDGTIRSEIQKFLDGAVTFAGVNEQSGEAEFDPFNPRSHDIEELFDALCNNTHIDREALAPPCWLVSDPTLPPARECVVCKNGILHVPSRTLLDLTPDYFGLNGVTFDYDPAAPKPETWFATLDQYWPRKEDGTVADEVLLLQEIFGYMLLPDTSMQKLFFFLGPTRSGKGTITKILTYLLGDANVCAPTLGMLGAPNGGQELINKSCAIIGEAGFGIRDDRTTATNLLKTIVGEDKVSLARKYLGVWAGRLLVRFILCSNKIPDFEDDSRAIGARLIALRMRVSWEGKEDKGLAARIADAELPGIMNWALAGYDRLKKAGKFTETDSGEETKDAFNRLASPARVFIEDVFDVTGEVRDFMTEDAVYKLYVRWCDSNGVQASNKTDMVESITSGTALIARHRDKVVDGGGRTVRPRGLKGLRLKPTSAQPVSAGPEQKPSRAEGEIPF